MNIKRLLNQRCAVSLYTLNPNPQVKCLLPSVKIFYYPMVQVDCCDTLLQLWKA